ncbi:MAG: Na+/H+ antiporter NhaC family protein [Catenibacillus sp.]
MRKRKGKLFKVLAAVMVLTTLLPMAVFAAETTDYVPSMHATFWALIPPVVAIVLALITKEVYSSLFIGILVGALFYSGFSFEGTITHIFQDGFIAVLSDGNNVGIIIFLIILGTMVSMMNRAGGSAAFGRWASKHIKTRVGAQLATVILGVLIFIDDYFNCLTVGSVMRPVTDKHQVSRAKLSYLIDATAAPVCIIAPISSWAAAVTGFVEGEDGLALFVQAIPYNFYALLTLLMLVTISIMKVDYGPMALHEKNAQKGDLFTIKESAYAQTQVESANARGRVIDLVIPIVTLIICCVIGMLYTGDFFEGVDFVTAFSNSVASEGLVLGSSCALVITIILYVARRVLSFKDCMSCLPEGFKAMVPAILILSMAWTLKAMTDSLGAAEFVAGVMAQCAGSLMSLLPAIIFIVGCFLAFATGTSWGTFGILIPIVVAVFENSNPTLMVISISACMAGAVCGDHCSPISDTTIMASAGAQCDHVTHVSTQLPYALSIAVISFITYIFAGFIQNPWICLPIGIVLTLAFLWFMKKFQLHRETKFRREKR